jgi:hypothetical protein
MNAIVFGDLNEQRPREGIILDAAPLEKNNPQGQIILIEISRYFE